MKYEYSLYGLWNMIDLFVDVSVIPFKARGTGCLKY